MVKELILLMKENMDEKELEIIMGIKEPDGFLMAMETLLLKVNINQLYE